MEETKDIIKRITSRTIASDVLFNLPSIGYWVKTLTYEFLDISHKATEILYWFDSNHCIGKTDFELAQELNIQMDEKQFAEVCRGSDKIIMDTIEDNKHPVFEFIELITWIDWRPHIWKTLKWVYPEEVNHKKYLYGIAFFMDEMLWSYEKALEWLETEKKHHNITCINKNLYAYWKK